MFARATTENPQIQRGDVGECNYNLNSPSFCASPNHLLIRFDILTLMKTAPDSFAIALASMVFPVPGGPNNKTPFWGPRSFP